MNAGTGHSGNTASRAAPGDDATAFSVLPVADAVASMAVFAESAALLAADVVAFTALLAAVVVASVALLAADVVASAALLTAVVVASAACPAADVVASTAFLVASRDFLPAVRPRSLNFCTISSSSPCPTDYLLHLQPPRRPGRLSPASSVQPWELLLSSGLRMAQGLRQKGTCRRHPRYHCTNIGMTTCT